MYSGPDSFMLYGKLGIDFFTTLDLLYPNMKVPIRLFRVRPTFYMISQDPNGTLAIVECSRYTRGVMLKKD